MKILIWAPFINKVGTTSNVINSIKAINKFSDSNNFSIELVNVFGEWNDTNIKDTNIKTIKLIKNKLILNANKKGFIKSRLYTILIILFSAIPLFKLIKKNNYNYIISHLITSLPVSLFLLFKFKSKLILSISGFPKLTILRKLFWKISKPNIYKIISPSIETKELLLEKDEILRVLNFCSLLALCKEN